MPLYEVVHIVSLTAAQKSELARAITETHSQLFTTPSLFVNVVFTDAIKQDAYVGGKKRSTNRIIANVRAGGGRSTEDFNQLCSSLIGAWNDIVNDGKPGKGDTEMRTVSVLGSIVAGSEAGFNLPPAGEDKEWLKFNMSEFEKRADAGDEDFKDVLEEMRTRKDLKELL